MRRLKSFATRNAILHVPQVVQEGENDELKRIPTLVFFITGNPGLISYYDEFLSLLTKQNNHNNTTESTAPSECVLAGFSLGGFELQIQKQSSAPEDDQLIDDIDLANELSHPPGFTRHQIYSLNDQIELCYARLRHLTDLIHSDYNIESTTIDGSISGKVDERCTTSTTSQQPIKVILIGHSVGAYISLELIRLHHSRRHHRDVSQLLSAGSSDDGAKRSNASMNFTSQTPSPSPSPSSSSSFNIISSILLTPTITHLAASPSGRIASPLLSTLPFLPTLLQLFSSTLTTLIPFSQVQYLVSKVTGMAAESTGPQTTTDFLRSNGAVKQALYMAKDELDEMKEDRWGEEVWGVTSTLETDVKCDRLDERIPRYTAPRLFFLFAQNDHWVADQTRADIISTMDERYGHDDDDDDDNNDDKRRAKGRPTVVIDEDGKLVHAWCIAQSEMVAERVGGWIKDILRETKPKDAVSA